VRFHDEVTGFDPRRRGPALRPGIRFDSGHPAQTVFLRDGSYQNNFFHLYLRTDVREVLLHPLGAWISQKSDQKGRHGKTAEDRPHQM
jgi:hypothetical protein